MGRLMMLALLRVCDELGLDYRESENGCLIKKRDARLEAFLARNGYDSSVQGRKIKVLI